MKRQALNTDHFVNNVYLKQSVYVHSIYNKVNVLPNTSWSSPTHPCFLSIGGILVHQ